MSAGDLLVVALVVSSSVEWVLYNVGFFSLYFSQELKLNQKFSLSHLVCVNNDLENDLVSLLEDQDQVSQPLCGLQHFSTWKVVKDWNFKKL